MKVKEFMDKAAEIYYQRFPESELGRFINKSYYNCVWLNLYLSKSRDECANGIRENDMFSIRFCVEHERGELPKGTVEDTEINFNLTLEKSSSSYLIKPPDKYLVYGRRKIAYRRTTGDPEKILKAFEKFVDSLKTQLIKDLDCDFIHGHHKELVKKKLFKGD